MKLFFDMQSDLIKFFAFSVFLLNTAANSFAASDSAHVISSYGQKNAIHQSAKPAVVALINLEDVMPDCQQLVAKAKVKSIQHSESGITTESITFHWSKSVLTLPTHMGDNPVLSLDDLIDATKFIKVGNTYFIHFQVCAATQERSLINMYAI